MQKIFDKKFCYIVYLIPLFLVAGPAIPDLMVSLLSILFITYSLSNKDFYFHKNKIFYAYLIFWGIIILSSLLSDLKLISLKSSFFHIRFLIFGFFIYLLIKKNNDFFNNFFPFLLVILSIVIFDGYFQFFFDVNTLGFDRPYANQRLSGFFNDEWILGSYLVRTLPLFLCVYILNSKKNNILISLFIFFYCLLIFLTGERASFFLLTIFIGLILLFFNIKKIYKFSVLLLIIIIPLIVVSINENIRERMFNQVLIGFGIFEDIPPVASDGLNQKKKGREIKCCKMPEHLFSYGHSKHYEVAIKMFLDKPLFGHGLKSFRYKCHDFQVDLGCSSHPHNTYVQLLAESGLFSFLLVFILFIFFCYLIIKNYLNRVNLDKNLYNARVCILGSFIMNLFPLVPTGSFFTNWLSLIYFFPLGILLYLYNYPLYEKKR